MAKKLIIIGGANGVGKTTFAYQFRDEQQIDYLGADHIAENLNKNDEYKDIKAGRIFIDKLNYYLQNKKSLIVESTLSGKSLLKKVKQFKQSGYSIHIVYIFLKSVGECADRVNLRMRKGGHNIPFDDLERRFYRSIRNFNDLYSGVCDKYQIFYNGFERPVEVVIKENEQKIVIDNELFELFEELSK